MSSDERPRIRPEIEFYVAGSDEEPVIHVHDPEGYATQIDRLSRGAVTVLRYFDGEHTLAEIQQALAAPDGTRIPFEQLEEFARHLDETALLDGAGFARAKAEREAWLESPIRPAAQATGSHWLSALGGVVDRRFTVSGSGEPSAARPFS